MENELKIGEYNHLRIIKEVPFGLYLDGYEDEILLPLQYVPETYEIDQFIDVFIYRDSEDRIIATTLKPKATINQFAYLDQNYYQYRLFDQPSDLSCHKTQKFLVQET